MVGQLRGFSGVPRYWNAFNITLPTVNAASTAELGVAASTHNSGGQGGPVNSSMYLSAQPVAAGTGAVAFPATLGLSHVYYNSTDGKIYFRFINPTAGNYTSAEIVTVHVVGF